MGLDRAWRWQTRFAVVLAGALVTASARGDVDDDGVRDRARRTFHEAQETFAAGNYAAAGAAFEEAARLVPHAATWLNGAEAWEKAGDFVRAAENCDRAAEAAGDDGRYAEDVERRLARLTSKIALAELEGAATARVSIDGVSPRPLPVRKRLAPGRHVFRFTDTSTGREREVSAVLEPGATFTWAWREDPPKSTPPAESVRDAQVRSSSFLSRVPAASWGAFALAGAAGAAGGVFGALTLDAKSEFEANPTRDGLDRFYRDRVLANALLGGAILALTSGIVIWALAPRATPSTIAVSLDGAFRPLRF